MNRSLTIIVTMCCTSITQLPNLVHAGDEKTASGQIRQHWEKLAENRYSVESGRILVDVKIAKSGLSAQKDRLDEVAGAVLSYEFLFAPDMFRAKLDESRPANHADESHCMFSMIGNHYRIIPIHKGAACLELIHPPTDPRQAATGVVSFLHIDPRIIGFWPGTFQSLGGEFDASGLKGMLQDTFNASITKGAFDRQAEGDGLCHVRWNGGDTNINWEWVFDQNSGGLPVDISITLDNVDVKSRLTTTWGEYEIKGGNGRQPFRFPKVAHFTQYRNGELEAEETWTTRSAKFGVSIGPEKMEWPSLGVWEGAVIRRIIGAGEDSYLQWENGKIVPWKPIKLKIPEVDNVLDVYGQKWRRLLILLNLTGAAICAMTWMWWRWKRMAKHGK